MKEEWRASYRPALLNVLAHDDEALRAQALNVLQDKVNQWSDAELKALLREPDQRKRGMAAYIAARTWKEKAVPELRRWLDDKSQLLRFDAMCALARHAGKEGRESVEQHRARERHPYLKLVLEDLIRGDKEEE